MKKMMAEEGKKCVTEVGPPHNIDTTETIN